MCEYSDGIGYKCPHKIFENSDYCIFHLQDANKDVDEFNKGIKEILETQEDLICLHGFYFPPESFDFSAQIFQNEMSFYDAVFSGDVNFTGATFSKYVSFMETKFRGDAHFESAEFSKSVNFVNTKFRGDVHFESATFSKFANSMNAEFSKRTDIGYVKLSEANFRGATFSKSAYFMYAEFSERADFGRTTFIGKAFFEETTFMGSTNFGETKFSKSAYFMYAELTGKFEFIPDKCDIIYFQNTYFSDNVRIKADMSKCSFANSNVERVDMTDSTWVVDNKPKDSYKIWEQRQGELSSDWKELEGIYRRLKQSCQKFGDNDTAGNFYYHEMECKRHQLEWKRKLFWGVFYKMLCGYGEKPWNVFWSSVVIILASSLFFFYWGIELLGNNNPNFPPRLINYDISGNLQWVATNVWKVFKDWLECLYTSAITFTTLGMVMCVLLVQVVLLPLWKQD